jgi:predicted Holliday junction resolvase-like endonuclease
MIEMTSGWIIAILAIATAASNVLGWTLRQQLASMRMEMQVQMAAMELRLSEKISGAYVSWQAHNDLEKRIDRLERTGFTRGD